MSAEHPLRRLILLTPIAPAPLGNGLAMRCELFRHAAGHDFEVHTVVVPLAGGAVRASSAIEVDPDGESARAGARELLADPVWRERLSRTGTLPRAARAASPGLAGALARALAGERRRESGEQRFDALHVERAYLAPLGMALAERLGVPERTLDLDDDDAAVVEAVHRDRDEARAYERLLSVFGGLYGGLCAASPLDAGAIAARHGVHVELVPNAVRVVPAPRKRPAAELRLLLLGNLTYEPNVEAATVLVRDVLPRVRALLSGRTVRVTLAGAAREDVRRLASPSVHVLGFVEDLEPLYADADIVVAPLRCGGGTRIKLLEAFCHGVPVVATPKAAEGLEVSDGCHVLLGSDADGLADAVARVACQAKLGEELVQHASRLVRERYSYEAVVPCVRAFLSGAARAPLARQPVVSS